MQRIALLAATAGLADAIDNGLGLTPPMGWRSWNLYGENVNQELIIGIMEGMVSRKRTVDGKPTSLCDLGYCDVGLDDNWQQCGTYGKDAYTYHTEEGVPQINTDRFPDLSALPRKAHELNLTAGWYLNNCICRDHCGNNQDFGENITKCYDNDVKALYNFGFDSLKLDGCGAQRDLTVWADYMSATGKPIMIENCHWGTTVPNDTWCPFNFYRTSKDVRASYGSVMFNLGTVTQWAQQGLSKPGCWAYPDMLEVGCQHGPGGASDPGLSESESRVHFGAWCIVSSPLTLSHDVNNDTVMDKIWPLIANPEAIAVNQAWAGHSGSPFRQSTRGIYVKDIVAPVPTWQYYYKPLGGSKTAILMINSDETEQELTLDFKDVPGKPCTECAIR